MLCRMVCPGLATEVPAAYCNLTILPRTVDLVCYFPMEQFLSATLHTATTGHTMVGSLRTANHPWLAWPISTLRRMADSAAFGVRVQALLPTAPEICSWPPATARSTPIILAL